MQPKQALANTSVCQSEDSESKFSDVDFSDPTQVQALTSALEGHLADREEDDDISYNPDDTDWDSDQRS
jgi:hypothetical protein